MQDTIVITGARENNLKNMTLAVPKFKLIVLTGPSGSGKSTLAMDTLQRECQRQYIESMGMAADAFGRPKVDSIEGLSPSISIGQHVTNRNPRSTVGTVTDIYTYLRYVFARLGERDCPGCGGRIPPSYREAGIAMAEEAEEQAKLNCPHCGAELDKFGMAHFSFNKPEGACETCGGLGHVAAIDVDAVFNRELGLSGGGVNILYDMTVNYYTAILKAAAKHYGIDFDPDKPLKDYGEIERDLLYYGVESERFARHFPEMKPPKTVSGGKFEGILTGMWRRYRQKDGEPGATEREGNYFRERTCEACGGAKLKEEARRVTVAGASISEASAWPLDRLLRWAEALPGALPPEAGFMLEYVEHGLPLRLARIIDVGLGYLSLNRQTVTLSGGEAQRLRLASLLGSGLTGVLYILDEPTRGLHPRDTEGLIRVLKQLRDLGNTVLVIEHDIDMMRAADHIIDIGPGAGYRGGTVVGEGSLARLKASGTSVTGAFLREEDGPPPARVRRTGDGRRLTVRNAHARNLKRFDASFPLGCLTAVTGVSGSGKSTLLFGLLAEGSAGRPVEGCDGIEGFEHVGDTVIVDQSPLSRMQRSNIATYTDVYTQLRHTFAALPEAARSKLTVKHFSFNTPGGRCENCEGLGVVTVDMPFMADLEVKCPVCKGRRFKDEVLRVMFEGHSISDLLNMSVEESLPLFRSMGKASDMVRLLCEVGLGYLQWGQSLRTLSGGEGQRIRLARELSKRTKTHTLYLLDEPTTGLHPTDVKRLRILLDKLVKAGNTVIVVEHCLELIREADWVVDIGPGGGEAGGELIAAGTPEQVAANAASQTGKFLKAALGGGG